ncbi:MAG: DUF2269 domain-containing protein [Rickettsiales bacterium]|nr:MAG: DUF2269 domain-containing protein [Rickettsiales bacterium]
MKIYKLNNYINDSIIKTIHIISSTILFGTGIGIAFFMFWANKFGDNAAKYYATKTTVLADFIFTTPAIIFQPISGILLVNMSGFNCSDLWLLMTYIGYIITVICWLPVVYIQIKMKNIASNSYHSGEELPSEYYKLFRIWFYLGWPAFISLTIIFFIMVFKPV